MNNSGLRHPSNGVDFFVYNAENDMALPLSKLMFIGLTYRVSKCSPWQ